MMRRGMTVAVLTLAVGVLTLAEPSVVPASAALEGSAAVSDAAGDACAPGTIVLTPQTPQPLLLLGAEEANLLATGEGVVVAVVDSGMDAGNPHLKDAVIGGINLVDDGERSDGLSDVNGHGTAIAGQIAAREVPGSGVIGIAPDAQLLSVRIFRSDSEQDVKAGHGPTAQRIADGIRWASDNGADIINVSLSQTSDSAEIRHAVEHAAAVGALVIASAGNRASDPDAEDGPRYPAAYAQALGVTATDARGQVTGDSLHGSQVDLAAPGTDILTAAAGGGDCLFAADAPAASFATAYASGAAALVAEAHPEDPPAGWAYRLTATALRSDADHRDDLAGWGFLQPSAAITLLPDRSTRGPVSPFFDTSQSAVRSPATALRTDDSASPFLLTKEAATYAAVIGAGLLGILGVLIVLRRRPAPLAGEEAEEADEERRGGLLERAEPQG